MKDTDAAWLAGFLDGEGSFMIATQKCRKNPQWLAHITASSVSELVLNHVRSIAGGRVSEWFKVASSKNGLAKPAKKWYVRGGPLVDHVLDSVFPFLVLKREQALILMALRSEHRKPGIAKGRVMPSKLSPADRGWRSLLMSAVKALNHRGTSPVPPDRLEALGKVRNALRFTETLPIRFDEDRIGRAMLEFATVTILGPGDLRVFVEFDPSVRTRQETVATAEKIARFLTKHWSES